MAETKQITFSHSEVVEALIRQQGLREGLWALYLEFGLQAMNAGPSANELAPAALLAVLKMGLQRVSEPSNLAVDAAKVNPLPARSAR
jgi:uncharacterized membrane protein